MSSKRTLFISGAAFIAMVLVFITTWDWAKKEDNATKDVTVRTIRPGVSATAPATTPPSTSEIAGVAPEAETTVIEKPDPPREVTYEEAEAAFHGKEYDLAVELFTQYTTRKSENPWGHYMLGLSAWKAQAYELAEEAFTRTLELDQGHVKSRVNLSRVLLDTSRPAEALEKITEVLEIDPQSNAAYRLQGRAYHQLGNAEEAIDAYRQAIKIDDQDAWSMNNLALVLIENELFDEALPPLARAVELKGDVAVFYNNLGMALERTGHFRDAERAYESAVYIDQSYEKANDNLNRITAVLEDPGLERVDLVVLAQSFVDDIESWKVAAADTVLPEFVEPATDSIVVSDAGIVEPDTTRSRQDF